MATAEHVIDRWARHPERGRPFVAHHHEPAAPAQFGDTSAWVPEVIRSALATRGARRLYAHQAEALTAIGEGHNVVISTPTASGKTLVYNVPVLTACLADPAAHALYLFPTKALAHDQVVEFDALATATDAGLAAHAYDGDTPADARRAIRDGARVVVTNPDMLHMGILPHHDRWQAFFAGLRYVIIDEVHVYRGVFGSHVANVLRRLRRIARFHGSEPRYILCSATIANAAAHAQTLIEAPAVSIEKNGAPRGPRTFHIYNPPIVDGVQGTRGSYVQAARRIAAALSRNEIPTIVFANSRLNVERLTRYLREDVAHDGGDPDSVSGYRGGYLPDHRRAIEAGLRSGRIRTVVSTSALELGIDIGQLEACVLAGYPGSVASALQRSGRAGRREDAATVVMVTRSEPVDQYIARNPGFFFGRSPEHARIQPDNLLVVADHIKCAAFELPFDVDEAFGHLDAADTEEILGWFGDQRLVVRGARRWQWVGGPYPAHGVGLRSIAEGNFVVLDRRHNQRIIGEVDFHAAASTLYPQAIYIVGGDTYQVQTLDWEGRRAHVDPVAVDYYTDAMTYNGVAMLDCFDESFGQTWAAGHGEVRVYERVVGFKKIRFATGENVGYGEVKLPDSQLHTTAFWLRPLPKLIEQVDLSRHRLLDALEGIGSALRHVASVHLMCDAADLGLAVLTAEGEPIDEVPGLPTVYLYERYPGGVGFHDALHELAAGLLDRVADVLGACRCEDGCPACVGAPAPVAHPDDRPRSRTVALRVLDALRAGSPTIA